MASEHLDHCKHCNSLEKNKNDTIGKILAELDQKLTDRINEVLQQ